MLGLRFVPLCKCAGRVRSKVCTTVQDVLGLVNIMQNSDNNEKNPQRTEEFQITITSEVHTAEELRDLLHSWVKEYEVHLNSDSHLKYFVYTPGSQATEDYYDATSNYAEFRFESGKNFDNIFFPEKENMVKRINFFASNKEWYKKRGIPYTMGFLLYGEPGCGKTSTIKAIANHTQRHIVSVPLSKIKTGKELLNVFYNVKMNYKVTWADMAFALYGITLTRAHAKIASLVLSTRTCAHAKIATLVLTTRTRAHSKIASLVLTTRTCAHAKIATLVLTTLTRAHAKIATLVLTIRGHGISVYCSCTPHRPCQP